MKTLVLKRTLTGSLGTFGMLMMDDTPLCLTVELPWRDNEQRKSCIPAGAYNVKNTLSPKHGPVWEVLNVKDRTAILIHKGNTINDLLGCIAPGMMLTYFSEIGLPGISQSAVAMDLIRRAAGNEFVLKIINCFQEG